MKVLLIAYGNPLRRDDGAGLALAECLARQWQKQGVLARHIASQQLVPELVTDIVDANATHIVFVDATPSKGNAEIRFRTLEPAQTTMTLGHQSSPEVLMYMAQHLYNVQIPAWLVTIPGTDFGHGEGFSAGVEELMAPSDSLAVEIITQIQVLPNHH